MTFLPELKRLMDAATKGPWRVDPDDRPGMSWNNHIVQEGTPNTICFMTHDPRDNSCQEAAAEIIVLLRNHAAEIAALVDAAELGAEYDALLRRNFGPRKELLAGDIPAIDAAYDKWQAANTQALRKLNAPDAQKDNP